MGLFHFQDYYVSGLFHFRLVPRFDPYSVEEYLSKFGLTLLHHVGPEEFMQRYKIQTKLGLDVIEFERLAIAAVIGECQTKFATR